MKFIIAFVLNILVSFVACIYLPWWSIAIVSFLIALVIFQKPLISLICGFLSIFILWAGMAAVISSNNKNILAHKVSVLILKADNPVLLIVITGIIGGLVAAMAALAGSYCARFMRPQRIEEAL